MTDDISPEARRQAHAGNAEPAVREALGGIPDPAIPEQVLVGGSLVDVPTLVAILGVPDDAAHALEATHWQAIGHAREHLLRVTRARLGAVAMLRAAGLDEQAEVAVAALDEDREFLTAQQLFLHTLTQAGFDPELAEDVAADVVGDVAVELGAVLVERDSFER